MVQMRPLVRAVSLCLCVALAGTSLTVEAQRKSRKKTMDTSAPTPPVKSDNTRSGRSMAVGEHGMVASAQPLATQAGIDILKQGGNAVDAAIAVAAALGVVEPAMTGIGGDAFMLYYDAETKQVYALNGSGRSPQALTRDKMRAATTTKIEDDTWEAVTVPGAVAAYSAALERFGSMSFAEVLAPAISMAEDGYPVTPVVATVWSTQVGKLRRDEWSEKLWLIDGRAPAMGEVMRLPNLGTSLRKIAEGGADAFYRGSIAEEIVRHAQATGGYFQLADFEEMRAEWVDPITTNYRGYDVYQCPPNGQGVAVLVMLNILEGYDLGAMTWNSPAYTHLLVEAKKLAYADAYAVVADPEVASTPLERMLSDTHAESRRKLIRDKKVLDSPATGLPRDGDTTCFVTADKDGNVVSFINSLYAAYGSGICGGETGIMLQNRGSGFSLEEGHPNEYAPGQRPFHTIIPGMVLKDGECFLAYGLMGGDMQPQGHVQYLTSIIDHGLNIQEAADAPRWRHSEGKTIRMETGTPESTKAAMAELGHDVKPGNFLLFGGVQAIQIHPDTGVYLGASDPRKDGVALGY